MIYGDHERWLQFAEADSGEAGGGDPPAEADPPADPPADTPDGTGTADDPPAEGEKAKGLLDGATDDDSDESEGDGDDGETQEGEEAEGAPEEYSEFTLPEGATIDKAAVEAFTKVARDLNLSQEQAQSLVDLQTQREADLAKAWTEQSEAWVAEAKADKEIGGAKFPTNLKEANLFIDRVMPGDDAKALRNDLAATGMIDNPRLIKLLYRASTKIAEGTFDGQGRSGDANSEEAMLRKKYPSMFKEAG